MKYVYYLLAFFLIACRACAQDSVYANIGNLLLRDRTGKEYNVLAVLRKGCPLKVEPYEFAENDKAVKAAYYHVSLSYDAIGRHFRIIGWVKKKYVSTKSSIIALPITDYFETPFTDDNPHMVNSGEYLPPKYKGGEPHPGKKARKYHTGRRGGCYYVNDHGHKVYVDKKFCKGISK